MTFTHHFDTFLLLLLLFLRFLAPFSFMFQFSIIALNQEETNHAKPPKTAKNTFFLECVFLAILRSCFCVVVVVAVAVAEASQICFSFCKVLQKYNHSCRIDVTKT